MGKYIFSTLTGSQKYPIYAKIPKGGIPHVASYVLIRGGANLPSKVFVTPKGVMTSITDEEYSRLQQSPSFQKHLKRGFLTVEDREYDPDKVSENLETKDSSAPATPEDFEKKGERPPSVAGGVTADNDSSQVRATQRVTQSDADADTDANTAEAKPPRKRRGRPRKTDA